MRIKVAHERRIEVPKPPTRMSAVAALPSAFTFGATLHCCRQCCFTCSVSLCLCPLLLFVSPASLLLMLLLLVFVVSPGALASQPIARTSPTNVLTSVGCHLRVPDEARARHESHEVVDAQERPSKTVHRLLCCDRRFGKYLIGAVCFPFCATAWPYPTGYSCVASSSCFLPFTCSRPVTGQVRLLVVPDAGRSFGALR